MERENRDHRRPYLMKEQHDRKDRQWTRTEIRNLERTQRSHRSANDFLRRRTLRWELLFIGSTVGESKTAAELPRENSSSGDTVGLGRSGFELLRGTRRWRYKELGRRLADLDEMALRSTNEISMWRILVSSDLFLWACATCIRSECTWEAIDFCRECRCNRRKDRVGSVERSSLDFRNTFDWHSLNQRGSIETNKNEVTIVTDVSVQNRWTNQQTQKRVEKNVQELNEFLRLSPDDVHDRLFELFLVHLMVTARVTLSTDLIVHLEEMRQPIVLREHRSDKTNDSRRQDWPENESSTKDEWTTWTAIYDCPPIWHCSHRDSIKSIVRTSNEDRKANLPSEERANSSAEVVHTTQEDGNRHESIDCYSTMEATRKREKRDDRSVHVFRRLLNNR